jgi:predicted nuclease of predicted toxin-antitoxin system
VTFFADESVAAAIIEALRGAAFNVRSIAEEHPGWTDEQVLALAFETRSVLLTQDKDFGLLVFGRELPHCGVVLIRVDDVPRPQRADVATRAILAHHSELSDAFTVISSASIRIRRPAT